MHWIFFSRTGGIVSIISNELLRNKLQNSDQRGPVQYLRHGLAEVISYGDDSTKVSYIGEVLGKPNNTAWLHLQWPCIKFIEE